MSDTSHPRAEDLAHNHWNWLVELLKKIYIDAFVHGYKHGVEDANTKVKVTHV